MSRGAAGAIETSDADGWAARRPQVCGRHAWIRPGFSDAARRGWPRKSSAWNQHRSARLPARTEPALADHTGTQEKRGTNGESGRAPETRIRAAQCGFQARPTSTRETTRKPPKIGHVRRSGAAAQSGVPCGLARAASKTGGVRQACDDDRRPVTARADHAGREGAGVRAGHAAATRPAGTGPLSVLRRLDRAGEHEPLPKLLGAVSTRRTPTARHHDRRQASARTGADRHAG